MGELWQAYGSWVLYGLFLLAFVWIHGRMHGDWGRAQSDEIDAERSPRDGQTQAAPPGGGAPHAHPGHKAGGQGHRHGSGCC